MNGGYTLRHPKIAQLASLSVRGTALQVCAPPVPTSSELFETAPAALAAMNAELLRLTAAGWSIADVLTEDDMRDDAARQDDAEADDHATDGDDGDDGPLSASVTREGLTVTVDANERAATAERAVAALRPQLECCDELVISEAWPFREPWYQTVEPWCAAVASVGSRQLTRFVVDTYFQPLTRQASVYCGDLTQLFRACPMLEFAYVIGCADLDALAHDRLEDLTLMGEPIGVDTLRAVLRGPSPRLTRLALGLSYDGGAVPGADAALLEALAKHGVPSLAELYIAHPENAAALLDALARSPILKQLRVLSIEGDVFDDEERGLAVLQEHRVVFSRLERLYLPLEDVTKKDDAELAAMIPGLRGTEESQAFSPDRYRTP